MISRSTGYHNTSSNSADFESYTNGNRRSNNYSSKDYSERKKQGRKHYHTKRTDFNATKNSPLSSSTPCKPKRACQRVRGKHPKQSSHLSYYDNNLNDNQNSESIMATSPLEQPIFNDDDFPSLSDSTCSLDLSW